MSDSDNQDFSDVDDGFESSATPKKSGSGFLPTLLKWVAIGLGALIVIVTIVVITVRIIDSGDPDNAAIPISQEHVKVGEVFSYYDIDAITVNSSDRPQRTIRVTLAFGYTKDDKNVSNDITNHKYEITDWLRRFFSLKTAADLTPLKENDVKLEIRNGINDEVLSTTKIKNVVFKQLDVIEM